MATILVTGGAGYIGSHACKALAAAGHQPVTFDNLVYGHREAVKWGPLEIGDLLDTPRITAVLEKYRPAAVLHFAAYAYVGESVTNPYKYYQNNVTGTLSLLQAMKQVGVQTIVFSSTCATYGVPAIVPIPETLPQEPINPYGMSKLMVERILQDASAAYGLRAVALRYFNAAGADPEGEIGEAHDPETHLIPLVLDAAAGRRRHIQIYGTDYPTPDGTCIRDYIHVCDLADAHVLALEYLQNGGQTDFFNLGNGQGFSVRQIIDTAEIVTKQKIPTQNSPRRQGDPPALVGDPKRATNILKWKPKKSNIQTQIQDAWKWHQKYHKNKPQE